jgi:tRNA-dihydrouridine synthase 1
MTGKVVQIGDNVKVHWPLTDNTHKWLVGNVVNCKKSKKVKYGSNYKYFIQFEDEINVFETRLIHLEYEIIKSGKKRKILDISDGKAANGPQLIDRDSLKYIVAPMVGASELAFRLLCRKYGATLAYTPMINSEKFAVDAEYRREEFQTTPEDRPIVAHFSANHPQTFLDAARHVEGKCDAIGNNMILAKYFEMSLFIADLNLGCPQRVAFSGHFGSYLLGDEDRELVLSVVKTLASNISIPVFVKIRLLNTVSETITLCKQLVAAGAALIAVHGRYRVNLVGRDGPGARDGAAHLDQIRDIRTAVSEVPIITNGNVITWSDVQNNMQLTGASGVMSAEGLLDNPALFNGGLLVDKLQLAKEYLALAAQHPVTTKCLVFHIRRMCKDELLRYQLLDDCLSALSVVDMEKVLDQAIQYQRDGGFVFDAHKEKKTKEAAERKKREEGKRKEYEARMGRKAKREGKPLGFYIEQGAAAPPYEEVQALKKLSKEDSFAVWKSKYAQHCYAFHFDENKCIRERTCMFLHADSRFVSSEVVAYG